MVGALAVFLTSIPLAGVVPAAAPRPGDAVELRGRVACLDEAGRVGPCAGEPRRFALEEAAGHLHAFAAGDELAGIFRDPDVRRRELLVRARPAPGGVLEIIKVFSVEGGVRHDLYYFCDVCHVTAYAPGLCPCCRQPMELKETPVP